jgi:uridylate kinase
VDGIYDADPQKNPDAHRFERSDLSRGVEHAGRGHDSTAITLCMDNDLPIIVVDLWSPAAWRRPCCGQPVGTLIEA